MASSTVFICYRREDSAGYAGRLFDRLVGALGPSHVFRDVDSMRPGLDFRAATDQTIAASDTLLVLIGPHWLAAMDQDGRRRLDNLDDLVRLEIEMGLARGLRVIPVLLPGAVMPGAAELPATLAPLAERHAFEIRDAHFDRDVNQLLTDAKVSRHRGLRTRLTARFIARVGAVVVLVAVSVVGLLFWRNPASFATAEQARDRIARAGLSYDGKGLVNVAANGDATAVMLFLRAGMSAEQFAGDNTALEAAVERGHFEVARLLIDGGASVDRALPAIGQTGHLELLPLLLARKPSREALGTALYRASDNGQTEVARALLDAGVDVNDQSGGGTPLAGASYNGHLGVVTLLLTHGAAVNAINLGSGGQGETALHYATRSQSPSPEIVGLLLKAGAAVDARDENGTTPLMNALAQRDIALVLLKNGANVNAQTRTHATPLMFAAARHLTDMTRLLVTRGAVVDAQEDHGWTPLMYTSGAIDRVDDPETVLALLDKGAQMNLRDRDGWTALMHAAHQGLRDTARTLISRGADRDVRNQKGQTAAALARAAGRTELVTMLSPRSVRP